MTVIEITTITVEILALIAEHGFEMLKRTESPILYQKSYQKLYQNFNKKPSCIELTFFHLHSKFL